MNPYNKVLIDGNTNRFYIHPKGHQVNPDLSQYVNETNPQAVEINEEEYQIYCDMGSTFQLCKVSCNASENFDRKQIVDDTKLEFRTDQQNMFRFVLKMKKTPESNRACI